MKYLAPGALIILTAAQAQTPEPTIIRAETRMVLVDTVALDHKNNFIRDLTQKDFRVWEDGKEQKISSFSLENAGTPDSPPLKHYIILFFDTSTLPASKVPGLRVDASRFLDRFATPDRYFAVAWYSSGSGVHIAQNFTTDAARLKAALAGIQGLSGVGGTIITPNTSGPTRPTDAIGAANSLLYRNMLASIRGMADSVAAIRGRKAIVAFSDGVNTTTDFSSETAAAIKAANKANVAVYGVGGGGIVSDSSPSLNSATPVSAKRGTAPTVLPGANPDTSSGPGANQNLVRNLAEGTGGLMLTNANDIPDALGRVAQEQDEYYLIGYTPAIESAEGTCHTLQVKADRGGLDLRARKGYCTSKDEGAPSVKTAGRDLEARTSQPNITATMQLPWLYPEPNVARVMLALDILPTAVKFQKDKGHLHAQIEFAGVAYKADNTAAARVNDVIKLDFATQSEADAFLKTPYHYTNTFDIAPGQYTFRMSVGAGDQVFGKTELPLTIDPYNGKAFALSALTLSSDAHPSTAFTDGLDESLLIGAHPLVSKGMEIVPAGTNRFYKGERAYFYFEAYHPNPVALPIRVRILDRATGNQKDDSGALDAHSYIRPGSPTVPIGMAVPIAGLAPGQYRLEVSANGVTRTADFDLN